MLESKAKYYDEVVSGKKMTGNWIALLIYLLFLPNGKLEQNKYIEEGDEEIFLVDFDKKVDEEYIKSKREG